MARLLADSDTLGASGAGHQREGGREDSSPLAFGVDYLRAGDSVYFSGWRVPRGRSGRVRGPEALVGRHRGLAGLAWFQVRGQRESLVLDKRPFANSVSYAKASELTAPPPLSVSEWQDFAGKHLASQTIVHTDGAQAYCAAVEGLELRRAP